MPDKSGLPSTVRGAGADRFGLPSGRRGIPGVGYTIHWALTDAQQTHTSKINATRNDMTRSHPGSHSC